VSGVVSQPARVVRLVLGVVAMVAGAVAFFSTREDAGALGAPDPVRLVAATAAVAVALLAAAGAWSTLLGERRFRVVLPGFLGAQLARYIPGSLWQGVSQVLDAERLGVRRSRATTAFLVQLGTQVVAATVVTLLVLLDASQLPPWLITAAVAAPLVAVPMVSRRWMSRAVAWLRARSVRFSGMELAPPSQRALVVATAFGAVNALLIGSAFGLLMPSAASAREVAAAAGAFAFAWLIGFLVVPLPAGLGVREALLVIGLGDRHSVAVILGAAVALRLLMIVVEAGLALVAYGLRRFSTGH
jgi:glycosyltransferase 2 family protein